MKFATDDVKYLQRLSSALNWREERGNDGAEGMARHTGGMRPREVPCVGAVITDADGRLLLIRRGRPPAAGLWSLPGGRVEAGETDQQAVVREVHEETGLSVAPGPLIGSVTRPGPDGAVYEIRDYAASVTSGHLAAGDDAADARWVWPSELATLPLTAGLAGTLTEWGVLDE